MALSDRIPYQAIVDRPKLKLPNGKRMAVWVCVNIEEWRIEGPMPRMVLSPPMGQPLLPDVPNWSWHEYGMRTGYWRFIDSLKNRNIKPTLALNGVVVDVYPKAVEEALKLEWELMGHGFIQRPMHKVDNEYVDIKSTVEKLRKFSNQDVIGWESPGLTETNDTIDVLSENGIKYVANWVIDDQPVDLKVKNNNRMLALPYTVEINDVSITAVHNHPSDAIFTRGKDQFDQLYKEAKKTTKIMCISIHPYLTGVPHRINYLNQLLDYVMKFDDAVFMNGTEIHDWYCNEIAI